MKNVFKKYLSILVLTPLALGFLNVQPAFSFPTIKVYLAPQNYIFDILNATIGTRFNVTVWVSSDTYPWKLMMWQVYITWNDDLINVTQIWGEVTGDWTYRAWPNDNLDGRNWDPQYVFYKKAGGTIGNPYYYHLGPGQAALKICDTRYSDLDVTGPKKLCAIEFTIVKLPRKGETLSCILGINNTDTFLYDSQGEILGVEKQDGYYEISYPAPPPPKRTLIINSAIGGTTTPSAGVYTYDQGTIVTVTAHPDYGYTFSHWTLDGNINTSNPIQVLMDTDHVLTPTFALAPINKTRLFINPPEIINPEMIPSSTFQINVTVDNIVNMKTCTFNLSYNTNVLSWAGINLIRIDNQLPRANVEGNDDEGYIWVTLTYSSPVSTISPKAIVTITFHVEQLGASILDLKDTEILDAAGNPIEHDAFDGFFMSLIRDIAVTNVTPSRSWVYQGWPVNITITVKNLGNMSETFYVKAYYGDNLIDVVPIINLLPSTETNVVIKWNTSTVPEGTYVIKGEATTVPYEIETSNNFYVDGMVQVLTVIKDIAVTNVTIPQDWAYQGWIMTINITVKNVGETIETFDVTVYYNDTVIMVQKVENLAPSEEVILTINWDTSSVAPCSRYTIKAFATILEHEYNENNNMYVDGCIKIRIPGDVDGDGDVNGLDLYYVSKAFGTYEGMSDWNIYADIDRNKRIDARDLWIVAKNFGKFCGSAS